METIEQQQELLNCQLKLDEYQDKLEKILNDTDTKKRYQDNINKYIYGILDINLGLSKIRQILEKKDQEFKVNQSIKNNLERANDLGQSISDLIQYALNINRIENEDAIVTVQNVTWEEYKNIVETIGEASWCKVSYFNGVLELMSPGINHERVKEGFSLIIQLYCIKNNIKCFAFGSSDLKKKNQETIGKQPDTGFSFFEDKENQDIAVESNFTSGGIEDLKIYAAIGIPEVWMYDIQNKTKLYSLVDQEYQEITVSKYLKDLNPAILNEIIEIALKGSINDVAHSLDTFMSNSK